MKRIVIACSKPTEQERLRAMLMRNGYTVVAEASNGMAALKSIRVTSPDIVLLEDRLPVVDGMQVAKILTEENPVSYTHLETAQDFNLIPPLNPLVPEKNTACMFLRYELKFLLAQKKTNQKCKISRPIFHKKPCTCNHIFLPLFACTFS